jgi:AraC-like DNA-binding protein
MVPVAPVTRIMPPAFAGQPPNDRNFRYYGPRRQLSTLEDVHALEPWIEEVTLRPAHAPITALLPDSATTLVWRMTVQGASDVLIAGPRTKASYHTRKELPACVRLKIRLGRAMSLLGTAIDDLADRTVPLEEVSGPSARRLADRLAVHRDDPAEAAELLGRYLLDRMPSRLSSRLDLVGEAAGELTGPRGVRETADRLGVSERYLRRVFRQAVGVSPKQFARIARVRGVIDRTGPSWSAAAATAGYTDQSHLIADFRDLMRVTPTAFATGRVPISTC